MIKRTFADVKTELARIVGQCGMKADDPRLREMVTIAQERLCSDGEWPYQYARLKFRQYGGLVSLPSEYESLVHATVDREPLEIQPSWFEFLEWGPGPTDQTQWSSLGVDQGESPVYQQPGDKGATIRVASTDGDDTGNVEVEGYDIDGVRQVETFALPDAESDTEWSKIVKVTKPVTSGDVVLSYTDKYGREYVAASYRYRDTTPSFRCYRFPIESDDSKLVHGVVRRRVFPIRSDSDELIITNLAALRLGVKAVALEDSGKLPDSEAAFAIAGRILGKEAKHYRAGHHAPVINVNRIGALSSRPDIY